jgi:hypothetical protein
MSTRNHNIRPTISSPTAVAVKTKYSPLSGRNNKKMFPRKQLKPRELTCPTVKSNGNLSHKENKQEVLSSNCELISTTSPSYTNDRSVKSRNKVAAFGTVTSDECRTSKMSKIGSGFDTLQSENGMLRQ